ncbi:MAG: (d)CMP kinase [Peptostreptococcaceae bacterium]|nr:(d)CMP kinase [Peptostreptococcaceae bacterium]
MTINNVIAIDGPSGSGKSTVSKLLAKRLSLVYIDTGAMYRAITWKIMENNIDQSNTEKLKDLINETLFEYQGEFLCMDGRILGNEIRTAEIDQNVSKVSSDPNVRSFLADQQIKIGSQTPSVIDGRDVGTVLFPDAVLKIYLTADVDTRAQRRYRQNCNNQINASSLDEIKKQIEYRDECDSQRALSPLKKASDAVEIDTGRFTIEEVIDRIQRLYEERMEQLCTMY